MVLDKNKKYKILTCCGVGQATSVLLAGKVKKVFDKLEIKATVEATQVSAGVSQGRNYDAIFCNRNLIKNFDTAAKLGCKIIGIKNIMDVKEIEEKLLEAFNKE